MGERSKADFLASLRADFAALPGIQVVIGQPTWRLVSHDFVFEPLGPKPAPGMRLVQPDLAKTLKRSPRISPDGPSWCATAHARLRP